MTIPIEPRLPPIVGITFHIPAIGRELTLRSTNIRVGRGSRCDLDLSVLADACGLPCPALRFAAQGRFWMVQNEGTEGVRVNGQPLSAAFRPIGEGDTLMMDGTEVLTVRKILREDAPDQPLPDYMDLFFESVSLTNGHVGRSVEYRGEQNSVVYKHWGIVGGVSCSEPPQELPVPPTVTTVEALREYVRIQRPGWPQQMQPFPVPSQREDILLYLGLRDEVRYDAGREKLLYTVWEARPGETALFSREEELTPPEGVHNADIFRDYIRQERPRWPTCPADWHRLQRNIQLDWKNTHGKNVRIHEQTVYEAEGREVVRYCQFMRRRLWGLLPMEHRESRTVLLTIPEEITTEAQLLDYVEAHLRIRPKKP